MADAEKSLMEDLAEAWEASEITTQEEPDNGGDDYVEEGSADLDTVDDEPAVGEKPEPEGDAKDAETDGAADDIPAKAAEEATEDDLSQPPKGLSPAAREAWADTPAAVKADIAKREKDFERGITQYAAGAKRAQQMDQALSQYNQLFAINGGNPPRFISDMLGVTARLQMGTPTQKAQTAALLIEQFGVDIPTLDAVLTGGAAPQQQPQQQPQPVDVQAEVDRILSERESQHVQRNTKAEVDAFAADPKNEFFRDVRSDMAVIFQAAEHRNEPITMQEAYDRACRMNPEVAQILDARKAAERSGRSRRAASSVAGSPSAPSESQFIDDRRAAIAAAWDTSGRV